MASYQVKFIKKLLSSDGHGFEVVQRVISVGRSTDAEEAARIAQHQFERLEHVPDWRLHADFCETSAEERSPVRTSVG
jgi:hypothetical protein